jgi:hypothetical protein
MFRNIRGRTKTWLTAGAGTIAAVSIAGLLGAFGALPDSPLPELTAGSAIETGQWRAVPLRAYVAGKDVYPPLKDGQKALVLEVEMTNRTHESSDDLLSVFRPHIPLERDEIAPTLILMRDPQRLDRLHPGMTERIAYLWTLSYTRHVPDQLKFTVTTKTYKPMDNLKGKPGWFNERPLVEVTLPVKAATPGTPS